MSKKALGSVVLGIIIAGGTLGSAMCLEKIEPGYAGIVYSLNGGVEEDTLGQGMHFVPPFKKVISYPVSTETMYLSRDSKQGSKEDDSFNVISKGGKTVTVDAELSYSYKEDMLHKVFTKWRGKAPHDIESSFIRARIKESCNQITSQYDVLDIYGEKLPEINVKIFENLKDDLSEVGINVENFALTNVEPDPDTTLAIQAKVNAQQKLEQDKIEAERQAVENQRKIDQEIAKQKQENILNEERNKRIEANAAAEAKAIKLKADAEAEANKKISASLSKELLELKKTEAWQAGGSQVPTIQGGDVTPFVDMRSK